MLPSFKRVALPFTFTIITWSSSPDPCYLILITWSSSSDPHHLIIITLSTAPDPCHLILITWSLSPDPCHLILITWSSSPDPCHLILITWSSSPDPRHLIFITWFSSLSLVSFTFHLILVIWAELITITRSQLLETFSTNSTYHFSSPNLVHQILTTQFSSPISSSPVPNIPMLIT